MELFFLLRPPWDVSHREREGASGSGQDGGRQGEVTGRREKTVRRVSAKALVRAGLPRALTELFLQGPPWCHSAATDVASPWERHLLNSQGGQLLTEEPQGTPGSRKGL